MIPRNLLAITVACALCACGRGDRPEAAAPPLPPPPAAKTAQVAAPPDASIQSPAPKAAPAASDAISDSIITARTQAGILTDPGMAGSDVSVNTDRGVVSLTGVIKSQEQAAIASAHAQRQDGVLRIDNHLAVNLN